MAPNRGPGDTENERQTKTCAQSAAKPPNAHKEGNKPSKLTPSAPHTDSDQQGMQERANHHHCKSFTGCRAALEGTKLNTDDLPALDPEDAYYSASLLLLTRVALTEQNPF